MAFDGLVTYTIVKELQNSIIDGKVDKIFEPNSNEIILGIYCNGTKYGLDIVTSSNCYRMCLTTSNKPNPSFAPNFCMVLRKYLLNTRITKIDMCSSLERVIMIEFEGHSKADNLEPKKLIIELMGKHSNIILVNSNNVIIDALKHFTLESNSYRNIIPNAPYVLPISRKLDFMQIENSHIFYQTTIDYLKEQLQISDISDCLKLSEVIPNSYTGISKTSINMVLQELQIEDSFNSENMEKIYSYLSNLIHSSHVIAQNFTNNDYALFLSSFKKDDALQVNFFVDNYYQDKENVENFITYRNNFSKLILNCLKKLNQKLSNINAKLKECQNSELYQLYGELITNNLYRIDNKHANKIEIENYYDNNNIISIPLDKTISPAMNAKRYFKKYHKLKNAKQIVELQKKDVESEINYIESIIYEFELCENVTDIDHVYYEFSQNFLNKENSNIKQKQQKRKHHDKNDSRKSSQSAAKIRHTFTMYY